MNRRCEMLLTKHRPRYLPLLILGACFLLFNYGSHAGFLNPFLNPKLSKAPRFPSSQLYQITSTIKLDNISGYIGAFGDFDSDKYTDLFVVEDNRTSVAVYLWDDDVWEIKHPHQVKIYPGLNITNIAATDFNHDGKLDLLVEGYDANDMTTTVLQIWVGDYQTLTKLRPSGPNADLPPAFGQPMIVDMNGDMMPDLFGVSAAQPTKRSSWISSASGSTWTLETMSGTYPPLADVHSNAVVDLNGDCAADLMLTTVSSDPDVKNYEVWLARSGFYENLPRLSNIPGVKGAGQLTFGDFDGDGNIDVMFPVCWPVGTCAEENSIRIIYNQQRTICTSIFGGSDCRKDTDLCSGDDSFTFEPFNANSGKSVVIVDKELFGTTHLYDTPNFPGGVAIRIGDFNLDRYPDLLVPIQEANGTTRVQLWESVPCTVSNVTCTQEATDAGRRTFRPSTVGTDELTQITGAYGAAAFDLGETGRLDILVLTETKQDDGTWTFGAKAVFNNFFNDAYFLKTVGLNGVCTISCGLTKIPDPKPYGVNQYGVTFKYTMSDLYGTPQTGTANQLSQSCFQSLQTPYTVSGLGRPSNYVEFLWFGIPIKSDTNTTSRNWPGIMPNSQVVASPYPLEEAASWTLELYISPSGVTLWIVIAVLVALVILGAAVVALHWREKKQDEKEKKEKEHLFSFKAL